MENIKDELKKVIAEVLLPETKSYLDDITKAIENDTAQEDDINAKNDIEAFIEELETIIEFIDENKISDEEAKNIHEKIILMLDEHKA